MSSRRWRVLAALIWAALGTVILSGISDHVGAEPASRRIATFGRHSIDFVEQHPKYVLVLRADDDRENGGQILVHCFPREGGVLVQFAAPHYTVTFSGLPTVIVWSDNVSPKDIHLVANPSGLLAFALAGLPAEPAQEPGGADAVRDTLESIESAERFIAYSHGGRTGTILSLHLRPAWMRFRALCGARLR